MLVGNKMIDLAVSSCREQKEQTIQTAGASKVKEVTDLPQSLIGGDNWISWAFF